METTKQTFDISEAIKAQRKYLNKKQFPHFAPTSGGCFNCRKNIYHQITNNGRTTGFSVETAGSTHVTYCPHCNRSYCD